MSANNLVLKCLQVALILVTLCMALVHSQSASANAIVNIDFDQQPDGEQDDLRRLFNPDSSPRIFNADSGGLNNTGALNTEVSDSEDIWTSKIGYKVSGEGDTYRLSAFFRVSGDRGNGGLGITTEDTNEPQSVGVTASGLGFIASRTSVSIVSSVNANPSPQIFQESLADAEVLLVGLWYHFELIIITTAESNFDVYLNISEANPNGEILNVVTVISRTGIVNADIANSSKVHPYLSANTSGGTRYDRLDDLTMRLSGESVVVPDPEADSDSDGQLDTVDEDDDGDGVNDEDDVFPFDETESRDNDNDGIGDVADPDDDNDNTPDEEDCTPLGESDDSDRDCDGVPNDQDAFPDDASETQDTDNDGTGDNADAFDNDPSEQTDTDGDGVGDNADAFDNDPNEQSDLDGDGRGDNSDPDVDGDGAANDNDAFPRNAQEQLDTDRNGIGNNADPDDDGDGVNDEFDDLPLDPDEQVDTDGNGVGNNADPDDDGDGVNDENDAFPLDPLEQLDTDENGIGNNADPDDDGDGALDENDDFPLNPLEQLDTDGNGIGNNADPDDDGDGVNDEDDDLPLNPDEQVDTDGNGIGNNADPDDDGDGANDDVDAFPLDPTEQLDTDRDGIGDNSDPFPLGEVTSGPDDSDGDGVADIRDAFPEDPTEWFDSDEDGTGNNADLFDFDPSETSDSDGDGVGDNSDSFPNDPEESSDVDNDGTGDNADLDNDNDGTPDEQDAFPLDPMEQLDTDMDGIGDRADDDDDNDGVLDAEDAFPLLPSETTDTDLDGIGNNLDTDDDDDGVDDTADAFPLDGAETLDTDLDGIGNNADSDDDNDGYDDTIERAFNSDPFNATSLPVGLDIDRDSLPDLLERGSDADGDGIGNEFDVDSDNDGIFDLIEASTDPVSAAALDADFDGMIDGLSQSELPRVTRPADTDGDGIRDFRDLDSDNDGIADALEITVISNNFITINELQNDAAAQVLADPDEDGLVNYRDLDSDNDGIPDLIEAGGEDRDNNGLADDYVDANADGMDDALFSVPLVLPDTDGDNQKDYLDLDSDNDGEFDIVDSGLIDADLDGDGRIDIARDSNDNGISDYADVIFTNGVDSDQDGIDDRVDASVLDAIDSDGDGIADRFDADSQGDGFIQTATIDIDEGSEVPEPEEIPLPVILPATPQEPAAVSPEPIVTTSLAGGGCSVAGPAQPDLMLLTMLVFSIVYVTLVRVGTRRTVKSMFLLFLSTSLAAGPAIADVRTRLYMGIGGSMSQLTPEVQNATLDYRESTSPGWTATAGFRINRSFDVELEYADLGTTTLSPLGTVDYQDLNISGIYHWNGAAVKGNGKKLSLYGRLGVGQISNQSDIRLEQENRMHWLAGAGVQMPLTNNLSLRAEGVNYDADVRRLGLSLTYQFGKRSLPAAGPIVEADDDLINQDMDSLQVEDTQTAEADYQTTEADPQTGLDGTQATALNMEPSGGDQPAYIAQSAQNEPEDAWYQSVDQMLSVKPAPESQRLTNNSTGESMPATQPQESTVVDQLSMTTQPDEAMGEELGETVGVAMGEAMGAAVGDAMGETINDTVLLDSSETPDSPVQSLPVLASALPEATPEPTPDALPAASPEALPAASSDSTTESSNSDWQDVLFGFDQSRVTVTAQNQLQSLVAHLRDVPEASVTLTGHTDNRGTDQYNQLLSMRRAEAVRLFLIQQGIDREMIRVQGSGEKRPVKSNATPSGRRANRRVEIVVN